VVVDRFRVRPDLALRLAESFETALKLSGGIARVAPIDEPERPRAHLLRVLRLPGLRLQHPGARAAALLLQQPGGGLPDLRRARGGAVLRPRQGGGPPGAEPGRRGGARLGPAQRLLLPDDPRAWRHYGFDVETPGTDCRSIRSSSSSAAGKEKIKLKLPHERGSAKLRPFEGIIRNMERRYRETDSSTVREELARYLSHQPCPACGGARLNEAARHVFVAGHNLPAVSPPAGGRGAALLRGAGPARQARRDRAKVIKEVATRLRFLVDVGLDYLTLERSAETLSGGEAQRIRLASQIGAGLVGVMYILDEPSIGLHQRDNARLLRTLTHLRDIGNTVIVVEHDEEAIRAADLVVDLGPGAGAHGGRSSPRAPPREIAATRPH
jgi:excinuclease ABC subunit A